MAGGAAVGISTASAHQSGCHRWHSCPSDTVSYVCGDLGYACQYPSTPTYTPPSYAPPTYPPPSYTPPTYTPPSYTPPTYTPPATEGSTSGSTQPSGGATPSDGGGSAGGAAGSARPPKTFRRLAVTVTSVVDGDTLKVLLPNGARTTVRVIGIDTPETKKPRVPVECGGREATALMTSLASGKAASLISDPSQDSVDRYGRLLGYVEVDGRDLGLQLVRAGRADVYVYGRIPFGRVDTYRGAREQARAEVLGVFATCQSDFHSEQ